MNAIRTIRGRLRISQSELAEALGCTQGNVSFYERGQTVPPETAGKLIAYAGEKGMSLSYDDIYGRAPKPQMAP